MEEKVLMISIGREERWWLYYGAADRVVCLAVSC